MSDVVALAAVAAGGVLLGIALGWSLPRGRRRAR